MAGSALCQWDKIGSVTWKKPFHLTPEYFRNSNRNFCPNGSIYILTEYFLDVIHSSEETKRKKEKDELRDVLAHMKQMDELFKKREKEDMETIAAMQKRIKELEGTMKPSPI